MSEEKQDRGSRFLRGAVYFMAFIILLLLIAVLAVRIYYMVTPNVAADAQLDALERANDAVNSVDIVLSFLEGASVLIGLGFGAFTLFGIRNTAEVRKDLEDELDNVRSLREKVNEQSALAEARDREMQKTLEKQIEALERYRPDLERLTDLRHDMERAQEELALVQQADQEFRLGNHQTAYRFATQVLDSNPDNWLALYIAGWLEVHQLDRLDSGIAHLQHVTDLKTDWPAAMAAYGVALRRKARKVEGEERDNLFTQAEGALLRALGHSPKLMDFNEESFWGPVGGIRLETGRADSAIEAYERALEVTPDSSYPAGNLATLYLERAHKTGNTADLDRALDAFLRTVNAAERERITRPNDYYLWMDIAQAQAILGFREESYFASAEVALNNAFEAAHSRNLLETSLRGWHSLLENCPTTEDWSAVRAAIQRAIATIDLAIEAESNA